MGNEEDIGTLRSRVAELVGKESTLLDQAFSLSRAGGDGRGVDALFAQVQALQLERGRLKKRIGELLGSRRLHMGSEVWMPGVYEYCPATGGERVRVRVASGALGLQVVFASLGEPVRIERLDGTFDGPLGVEEAVAPEGGGRPPESGPTAKKPAGRRSR